MSIQIKADALRLLKALAEFAQIAGDSRRGRYTLSGRTLFELTKLDPESINDAVDLLEHDRHVSVDRYPGTGPFTFGGVELSTLGRVAYQSAATASRGLDDNEEASMMNSNSTRNVFVVHGRNGAARDAMFSFLRSIDLCPLEWEEAVKLTGKTAPYIGEVLDAAFAHARAVVVLLTGDDEARLREEYHRAYDPTYEKVLTSQARANVLFEAGMALGRNPERTLLIEFGALRPFSDAAGRHSIRINSAACVQERQAIVSRLRTAGCDAKTDGRADWLSGTYFDAVFA